METKARYLLIGSFMLAATVMVFGFVFWLGGGGGLGRKQTYVVRFGDAASGLQPGAAVLFDGIRVGEVSDVKLDPADFQHVLATVSVGAGTPVRADTKVGMESQGLMGTAVVSLKGASSDAPPAIGAGGAPAMLTADPNSGKTLTKSAQDTLERLDKVIADNSDSFGSTMVNLKTFTAALARNSDRIDGVMAGLEKMTGGGPAVPTPKVYDLDVPKVRPWTAPAHVRFLIADPTAVIALQTQRLLTRAPDGELSPRGEARWSDTLPKLLQEKILQGLQDAGVAATLDASPSPKPEDRQLQIDLRDFEMSGTEATVAFAATVVSGEGRIVDMKVFRAEVPAVAKGTDADAVKVLNAAFGEAAGRLAAWMMTTS